MPFANETRLITPLLADFSQCYGFVAEGSVVIKNAVRVGVLAREHTGPRGGAEGRGHEGIFQVYAFLRE